MTRRRSPRAEVVRTTRVTLLTAGALWVAVAVSSAQTPQDGVEEMRRGLAALRAKDAHGALDLFQRASEHAPVLRDWAHLYAAEAAAGLGDVTLVRAHLAATDPWLAREWGWQTEVAVLRRTSDSRAVERALEAGATLESGARRAEALRIAAEIQLERRDTAGAITSLRRAIAQAPESMQALDAGRLLSSLPRLSAEDQRELGLLYARHGNATRALAGLDRYVASGRGTIEERQQARLDAARALFAASRYTDAERRLTTMTKEKTSGTLDAEALLLMGRAQFRLNRVTAARATLLKVAGLHPHERAAAEALYIVADLDHDRGELDVARERYRMAIAAAPQSEEAGLAAMRLGGLEFAAGRAAHAAVIFEEFRAFHSGGRRHPQASYWAARSHLLRNDTTRANPLLREVVAMDPASFYGLRSAELLGARWMEALAPSPMTGPQPAAAVHATFARLDALRTLSLQPAYDLEVERAKRAFGDQEGALYAMGEELHARGEVLTAVRLGREIQRLEGKWNPRLLRIVYPFPYREEIVAQAKNRGLDPFLVAGLIRQESLFNAAARSSAGALGLMQVMPSTGRSLSRRAGTGTFQTAQLHRPEPNLRMGTLFFADLLTQYNGQVPWVLAAYNAGPSRVARWRQMPEAIDPDLFAERIPFAETRDYVKIVQQNARIYAGLYTE